MLDDIPKLHIFLALFQIPKSPPAPQCIAFKTHWRQKCSFILNAFLNTKCTLVRLTFSSWLKGNILLHLLDWIKKHLFKIMRMISCDDSAWCQKWENERDSEGGWEMLWGTSHLLEGLRWEMSIRQTLSQSSIWPSNPCLSQSGYAAPGSRIHLSIAGASLILCMHTWFSFAITIAKCWIIWRFQLYSLQFLFRSFQKQQSYKRLCYFDVKLPWYGYI